MIYQSQVSIPEGTTALPPRRTTSSQRAVQRRAARLEASIGTDRHHDVMFVIRESDVDAFSELAEMIEYTLRPHVGIISGVDTVLGLGLQLVERTQAGDELRESFSARTIYGGVSGRRIVGWVFEVEGTLFVLSLYSAAKANERETNDFTDAISDLVKRHSVSAIYTGRISRLVRSKEHSMQLRDACRRAGTVIYAQGRNPVNLTTESGRRDFDLLVEESVADYLATVERLTTGAHAKLMDGQYPKSEEALPALGYRFRDTPAKSRRIDRTPIPDLSKLTLVRDLITWGASDLTDHQIAELLANVHGWGSETLRSRLGNPTATVLDARHPATAVRQLWLHLDLFETGKYVYETHVPISDERLRADVVETSYKTGLDTTVRVEIDFHHELLPDGQWVEPDLIQRCRLRRGQVERDAPKGRCASISDDRKPLAGIAEWTEETSQYRLSARHSSYYLLQRRPADLATTPRGTRAGWLDDEATDIAWINPSELHDTLGNAIVIALDHEGFALNRKLIGNPVGPPDTDPNLIQEAEQQLADARRAARRAAVEYAMSLELHEEDPSEATYTTLRAALAARSTLEHAVRTAEQNLARLTASARLDDPISVGAEVDVDDLARCIAALIHTDNRAPAQLNVSLRKFISSLRLQVSDDGTRVEVSCTLRIRTSDGTIEAGPIQCSVTNRQRSAHRTRRSSLLRLVLRDGHRVKEAAELAGFSDAASARRVMLRELVDTGLMPSKGLRSAILDCPTLDARRVVWASIEAERCGIEFALPGGVDPDFAAHIRATYLRSTQQWLTAWCSDSHTASRAAIAAALAAGDIGLLWKDLEEILAPWTTRSDRRTIAIELVRGKGTDAANPRTRYAPVLERSEPWHRHAERRVWARHCPYCQTRTLTHVLRVPEVPGGLLCTTCHRAPTLPNVCFPDDYLRLWSGPRGFAAGRGTPLTGTIEQT